MVKARVDKGRAWSTSGSLTAEAETIAKLFLPLMGPLPARRPLVVGHLAQSMDGYIARLDGESHWISGSEDLDHTHRLRAFCDAVLVGANTVSADDCRLTVRRCSGDHPLRVVLDPSGRLNPGRAIFQQEDGAVLHVVSIETGVRSDVERLLVPAEGGQFELDILLTELHTRGIRRLFIEGGGVTLTRFLTAGLLDRLHLTVAPVLLGNGRPGFATPLGDTLSDSPRPRVTVTQLGDDWLFDCEFGVRE